MITNRIGPPRARMGVAACPRPTTLSSVFGSTTAVTTPVRRAWSPTPTALRGRLTSAKPGTRRLGQTVLPETLPQTR